MAYATTQQLTRYYDTYKNIDVTFTKEVTAILGLQTQQVFIKADGRQWPCIINSSSLVGAKVIAGTRNGLIPKIQKDVSAVNLRFSFVDNENKEPVSFFINSKAAGFSPYGTNNDLVLIQLQYIQRAPDFLIEKLGSLLDANVNSKRRREDRILVTADTMRKIGILQKETIIFIQGVPRRCIIRDISFSGAKVIMIGIAQFIRDKDVVLRIDFEEPRTAIGLHGKIIRTEDVRDRKDLVALAIQFVENEIPMTYKMHLNHYISSLTKHDINRMQNQRIQQMESMPPGTSPVSRPAEQAAGPANKPPEKAADSQPETAQTSAGKIDLSTLDIDF